jgi:hypothetical protein
MKRHGLLLVWMAGLMLASTPGAASELRILEPDDNERIPGIFDIDLGQKVQGGPNQGLAYVQFSNSANGPWSDAQSSGGAIEYDNPAPWTAQDVVWSIDGCNLTADCYLRVEIRDDMGDPFLVSEPTPFLNKQESALAP